MGATGSAGMANRSKSVPCPAATSRWWRGPASSAASRRASSDAQRPERGHRAGLDQRLDHALVDGVQVDAAAEVVERGERPRVVRGLRAPLARGDDGLDRPLADVLDGDQAEADRGGAVGIGLDAEEHAGLLHVRRADLDPQPPALGHHRGHLLGALPEAVEHRGHELDRVVGLEVGGLVRDQPVAGGVGLVEPVAGERLEGGEDLVHDPRRDALLLGAGLELGLVLAQDRFLLLADRVAQVVRLGTGVVGHGDGRGHDVFLVDEDPVRVAQRRLQRGVQVGAPPPRRACGGCRTGCWPSAPGGRGRPWPPGRAPRWASAP